MGITPNIKKSLSKITHLPKTVKYLMINTFLFVFGRGLGGDIFLGIYIEQIIDKVRIVGALGALLAATKLSLSIPIGYLNGKINPKYLLIIGRFIYITSGIAYFTAGVLQSPIWLIIGVILNGIASPILFTTIMSVVRSETDNAESTQAFGLYQTATQGGYFFGAIIISFFIDAIPLHYVFLALIVFAFISMIGTTTIPMPDKTSLRESIRTHIFHQNVYKKVWHDLKEYNITLYLTLFLQFLYGLVDYIGFLFIPLLGFENHLTLGEIALIFAIMRIPHLLSAYLAGLLDKYNQFVVVCSTYIIIGCVLGGLGYTTAFGAMLILSLCISMGLAILRPILSGFISRLVENRHKAEITGVQETVTRVGEVVGSIGFAIIAQYSTIQRGFFIVGVLLILIATGTLFQQNLFRLPRWGLGVLVKDTMTDIFDTFKHYARKE